MDFKSDQTSLSHGVSEADVWICDELAPGKVTANEFCAQLLSFRAKTVNVHIDSNGGLVNDGFAIYDALMAYPGEVVVHIDGFCGSICPIIAMAGRRILMAEDAVMLIHQSSATISGTFDKICQGVRLMANMERRMVQILSYRSGLARAAVIALMRSGKLLSAAEALELRLCDTIVPEKGLADIWDFGKDWQQGNSRNNQMTTIEVEPTAQGQYQRRWARIPKQQSVPAFLRVSKPALDGTFPQAVGSYRVFKPDTTVAKYDAYAAQAVGSESGAPSFYPSGGVYPLSFAGSSTSNLGYTASSATVQSALNGLTPVSNRGNVTVTGSYNSASGFVVTFASIGALTVDTSGLTASSQILNQSGTANGGYTQSVFLTTLGAQPITAGTFTISILSQTTAGIAYNATLSAVQSALNALSNVAARGGIVVTGAYSPSILNPGANTIAFSLQFSNPAITGDATSLTPIGSTISVTLSDGGIGRVQTIQFASPSAFRNLYVASGHGIVSGDTLYIKGDISYLAGITTFSVIDSNTIQLAASPANLVGTATAISEVGKRTKQSYQAGVVTVRANLVTNYYFPGVTAGVSTSADIPAPAYQGDPETLLAAVFSGSGTINVDVGGLTQWVGPILSLTTTQVNAADL